MPANNRRHRHRASWARRFLRLYLNYRADRDGGARNVLDALNVGNLMRSLALNPAIKPTASSRLECKLAFALVTSELPPSPYPPPDWSAYLHFSHPTSFPLPSLPRNNYPTFSRIN